MTDRKRGIRRKNRHEKLRAMFTKNLRDLPSIPFGEQIIPPEFRTYTTAELIPLLTLTGNKIPKQQETAIQCLHNAVLCGLVGHCVADTRSNTQPGARMRVRVWDALVKAGLVVMQTGSESSGKVTRYLATKCLLEHFREWPVNHLINTHLKRNFESQNEPSWDSLIVLKNSRKNGGSLLQMPQHELDEVIGGVSVAAYLECVEDDIECINRSNSRHTWEAFKELPDGRYRSIPPNFHLRQIHVGNLMRYARQYTWSEFSAQNLSQHERQMMKIDGEPVAEFDYAGHNVRILYHILGIEPGDGDVYRAEDVLTEVYATFHQSNARKLARKFVKLATNILLNTTTRGEAVMGVAGLLHKKTDSPKWKTMLRRGNLKPRDVVDRIVEVHPEISHRFFTEIGADLQTIDGMLMRDILMVFAKSDRPVLGVHDSIVVRASDAGFAESWMKIPYYDRFGFWPVVRRVY